MNMSRLDPGLFKMNTKFVRNFQPALRKHCKVGQENLYLFTSLELSATTFTEIWFLVVWHKIDDLLQIFKFLPLCVLLGEYYYFFSFLLLRAGRQHSQVKKNLSHQKDDIYVSRAWNNCILRTAVLSEKSL